jgi:hypothetical protein
MQLDCCTRRESGGAESYGTRHAIDLLAMIAEKPAAT